MTISAFSDELAQVRTKKKEFLSQIERIVPWKEWLAMIQPCYYKGERGNKPYPLEKLSSKVMAWIVVIAVPVVLFTFVGVNTLLPGLHSYG